MRIVLDHTNTHTVLKMLTLDKELCPPNKLYKKEFMLKALIQIHQILKLVEKVIHIFFI